MANYGRESRMGGDIRKKGKVEKATEFVKRMRKVQEEAGVVLKKAQKDMKRQVDKRRISQIRYSLVVILGLNSVSGVQYKDMMINR